MVNKEMDHSSHRRSSIICDIDVIFFHLLQQGHRLIIPWQRVTQQKGRYCRLISFAENKLQIWRLIIWYRKRRIQLRWSDCVTLLFIQPQNRGWLHVLFIFNSDLLFKVWYSIYSPPDKSECNLVLSLNPIFVLIFYLFCSYQYQKMCGSRLFNFVSWSMKGNWLSHMFH